MNPRIDVRLWPNPPPTTTDFLAPIVHLIHAFTDLIWWDGFFRGLMLMAVAFLTLWCIILTFAHLYLARHHTPCDTSHESLPCFLCRVRRRWPRHRTDAAK